MGEFFCAPVLQDCPLFYLLIALTLIRDKLIYGATHSLSEIAASATFIFNLVPQGQPGFVWASWTIGIEMLFYALFPIYYMLAKDRWQAVSLALWLLIGWTAVQGLVSYFPSDPTSQAMFLQWTFLRRLPVFACGAIAYHLLLPGGYWNDRTRQFGVALSTIAVAIYVALVNGWLPNLFGDPFYWQGICFTLLLLGLGWAPAKVAVNRITKYLGRISYSLYLNHPTIVLLLSPLQLWIYRQDLGLTVSFLACLAVNLATAIAVSEVTYRLVELPGIQIGKRLNLYLRHRWQHIAAEQLRPAQ